MAAKIPARGMELISPSFMAHKNDTAQTIANNTNTQVTFETEIIDSNGTFASNRFTPAVEGYYLIGATVSMTNHPQNAYTQLRIKKNGSDVFQELNLNQSNSGEADTKVDTIYIEFFDSDDYIEVFVRQNSGGDENTRIGRECRFFGFRIN